MRTKAMLLAAISVFTSLVCLRLMHRLAAQRSFATARRMPARSTTLRGLMTRGAPLVAAMAGLAALAAFLLFPAGDGAIDESSRPAGPTATATAAALASGEVPAPTPTAQAQEAAPGEATGQQFTRLMVPALGIDASIITLGIDPYGTMESPDNPSDVAWYNFSSLPGAGSNVVMAGHLDFAGYGPAVFYRLREAKAGDEVQLTLIDGTVAYYRVQGVTVYDEATAPVQEIVGPTDREMVTLITCGGSFDPLAREYDKRVILRAERVAESAIGAN